MLLDGLQPCRGVFIIGGRLASAPEVPGNNSGDRSIAEFSLGQPLQKSDHRAARLIVLSIKQSVARSELFGDRFQTDHLGGKAGFLQNYAGLEKVTDPIKDDAFAVVLVCLSSLPAGSFDCNGVWNGMAFAKRFDLSGIQIVEIRQQFVLFFFLEVRDGRFRHTYSQSIQADSDHLRQERFSPAPGLLLLVLFLLTNYDFLLPVLQAALIT